jgi:hypothetical protein
VTTSWVVWDTGAIHAAVALGILELVTELPGAISFVEETRDMPDDDVGLPLVVAIADADKVLSVKAFEDPDEDPDVVDTEAVSDMDGNGIFS